MNITYFCLGYAEVFAEGESALDLINLCMRYSMPYGQTRREPDGVTFLFRLGRLKTLKALCKKEGIEITVKKTGGLPVWLHARRHRYGLMAGVIAALFLVVFMQNFIWRIDVVGNESITTEQILDFLEDYGLFEGSYIPRLNTDKIQNSVLIESDKISWISVNINGNIASVEVREISGAQEDVDSDTPANLVASKSGQIVQVQVLSGNVVVASGDFVEEGELLVSGIFDSKTEGYRVTRAEGKVYAQTSEEFYIKIPYEYEKKVYTGNEYCDEYLNFFNFSIKISKNSGNTYALYDKISIVDSYSFLDGERLPMSKTTEKYLEYETQTANRTAAEAQELAYFELSQRLGELSQDAILVRKVIMPEIHDDFFALRCVIVCIEDIAQTVEFDIDITLQESEDKNEQ